MKEVADAVEGYVYRDESSIRNGWICQILEQVSKLEILLDAGPTFFVKHKDGKIDMVPGALLTPWFPV